MPMTQIKKTHIRKIHWLIVFLYICWIFSNSLNNGNLSSAESGTITRFILQCPSWIGITIPFDVFHHFIRKLAHFLEYALLGFLTSLSIHKEALFHNRTLNWIFFGIIPPLMDEGIQHFVPGRYGALTDSFLDMSGYCFGTAVFLICFRIHQHFHNHRR